MESLPARIPSEDIHLEIVNLISTAMYEFGKMHGISLKTYFKTQDDKITVDVHLGSVEDNEAAND